MSDVKEKKKPGRKKKVVDENITNETAEVVHKKRGRKPKGGKIITTTEKINNSEVVKQNIILHLKCCMADIKNIYDVGYIQSVGYNSLSPFNKDLEKTCNIATTNNNTNINISNSYSDDKEIWGKLKSLASSLHSSIPPNKISDCFWCNSQFDGPPVFIPKNKHNDKFNVYGNFCSPECGCAFLFNENIDTSQKFERYHLLNHIYSSIYNYDYYIKPAPSPYYLLNKYLGSLSVEEYRKINKNNQLISVIDKPMTRNFPELFEDVDEQNIKNLPIMHDNNVSNYKLFKKSTANKNKSLSENFNMTV
jgi:hypothetical protein